LNVACTTLLYDVLTIFDKFTGSDEGDKNMLFVLKEMPQKRLKCAIFHIWQAEDPPTDVNICTTVHIFNSNFKTLPRLCEMVTPTNTTFFNLFFCSSGSNNLVVIRKHAEQLE
jgi:hypothetical protein